MVPKIAISYRRSDSQDITGRIFDRLRQHFGKDAVFRDIDNIRPGIDFRVQISEALQTTDVLLVVVGPKWFGRAKGADSRIDNKADPVRIEVETALQRDIPVIPVLVGSTKMPTTDQLPDGLKDFAYRHAVTVDGGRDFDHHLEGLIRALDGILDAKANSKVATDEPAIRTTQSLGVPSLNILDAAPDSSVAGHVGPSSATTLQTESPKAKTPDSAALVRLIWPQGRMGRVFRVVLVAVLALVAAAAIFERVQVAENSRRAAESQFEVARKAAEAKAAEDVRKAAAAKAAEDARKAAEAKAAEDARIAAEAKAAEDVRKAAAAKAAEDARKAAEAKAAEAKAAEAARKAADARAAEDARKGADAKAAEAARKAADAKPDLETLRKAAEAGDVDAMVSLASRYFDHKGETYDFAEAMRWWKRAANSGNSSAMRVVGFQSSDPQEALRWYRKAAEAGDGQAISDLPDVSKKANVTMDVQEEARWRLAACKVAKWLTCYLTPNNSGSLRVGVRQAVQDLLRSAGVYRGPSTGEFDEATLSALKDYYAKAPDMPPKALPDTPQPRSAARGQGVQENLPSPTSVESLSETKWSGTANSDPFEVEFNADHTLKYGGVSYANWSQNGKVVHMEMNHQYSIYDGMIEGNQMKGTARNQNGFSWKWSLTKQ
jgi:TPR repeat protein